MRPALRTGRSRPRPADAFDRRLITPMILGSGTEPGLLLVHSGSAIWLPAAVGTMVGVPQGLIGLANQSALYRQADAARMGSAAGLLRTFTYMGAMAASAADAAFFAHGAHTPGLHHLALFMLAGAVLLLTATLLDRSLRNLTPRKA
ncbi:hypothetical protein ACFY93_29625 [Streptomyces sp. NPDC008313]|uniref:hypothetical protein n=1 Tax=Streptomyces sp. NPDC008313 TaxID=3364826 RepID=UPI0036ED1A3A